MKKTLVLILCVVAMGGCFKKKKPLIEKIDASEALSVRTKFHDCRDSATVKELRKCVGGDFPHKYGECLIKEFEDNMGRDIGLLEKGMDVKDRACCIKLYVDDPASFVDGLGHIVTGPVLPIVKGIINTASSSIKCNKQKRYFEPEKS